MRTVRPLFVLLMALLLALASAPAASPAAAQGNGSHGDVKVHSGAVESPARDSNDPKVCTFHFHGTNFDPGQTIDWHVDEQDPHGAKNLITGSATTDANGAWATGVHNNLANGHYKLNWEIRGIHDTGQGDTKFKEFEVACSTIQVQKYNDLDGDGKKDAAEPYLAGWDFNVTLGSTSVGTMTTNADGIATLKVTDEEGAYTVTEVAKSGWSNTEPGNGLYAEVSVKKGKTTELLFGNHYTMPSTNGTIRVFKYSDVNNNGSFDTGDLGLSGWGFTVKDGQGTSVGTITTGADGNGTLSIAAGSYTIYENLPLPANWTNTDPAGAAPSKPVTVTSGQQTDVRFGNHYTAPPEPTPTPTPTARPAPALGTLLVAKYNDQNRNGVRDAGEPGLAGWTFNVGSGSTIVRTITTGSAGTASTTLGEGSYTVTEVTQPGWTNTDPAGATPSKTVSIDSGAQTAVAFGNAVVVIIPQTTQTRVVIVKYADANANGARDAGEAGLASFTFSVRDASGAVVGTAVTGADGLATISNLPLGAYTITEEPRTGWVNTEPGGNGIRAINLTSTATSATVVFGNAQVRLPSTATDSGMTGTLLVLLFIAGLACISVADRTARRT